MFKNYDEFELYLKIQFVPRRKQSPFRLVGNGQLLLYGKVPVLLSIQNTWKYMYIYLWRGGGDVEFSNPESVNTWGNGLDLKT